MHYITPKEYLEQGKRANRRRKYNNRKIELDGYVFDSKLEADYYTELKLRKQAKDIKSFKIQPRYLLQNSFVKENVKYQKIEYVADFEILHNDGSIEVIDTKGVKTAVFRIKEKMFHKRYSHKLTLVTKEDFYTKGRGQIF